MQIITRNPRVIQHSTPNAEDYPMTDHELVKLCENRSEDEAQNNEDCPSDKQKACAISIEDLTDDGGEEELG